MWSKLPARFVARMLSAHSALGLAASALLYILCVSGTLIVFHHEFMRWEQPGVAEFEEITPAAVQRALQNTLQRSSQQTGEKPAVISLTLPVPDMPRVIATAGENSWYVTAQGELQDKLAYGWTAFLIELHFYLTLPGVLGLTLVGILGILMLALVFSGVLSHPRLFRDAFHLRLGAGQRLRETDIHNRLSVWASPFHIIIAFTGAALGLASVVALVMSGLFMDGNAGSFFNPVFGAPQPADSQPAPLADVQTALRSVTDAHPELLPTYISVAHPATQGQSGSILVKYPDGLLYGDSFWFNPAGEITGKQGMSDGDAGKQIIAALYPLHFGTFGQGAVGVFLVKLAYFVLGIALCVVVVGGVNIWLIKRRQRGRAAPTLENAWQAIVWGTPAVLAAMLLARLLGLSSLPLLVASFWLALVVAILAAVIFPRLQTGKVLQWLSASLLFVTVMVHFIRYTVAYNSLAIAGISASLLVLAVWFFWHGHRHKPLARERQ